MPLHGRAHTRPQNRKKALGVLKVLFAFLWKENPDPEKDGPPCGGPDLSVSLPGAQRPGERQSFGMAAAYFGDPVIQDGETGLGYAFVADPQGAIPRGRDLCALIREV